jgi:hypothetical protein
MRRSSRRTLTWSLKTSTRYASTAGNEAVVRTRDSRAGARLCRDCLAPRMPGRTRCEPCLERIRVLAAQEREERRQDGWCITCGYAVEPGRKYCPRHLAYYRRRSAAEDADDRAKRDRARRAAKRARGECAECPASAEPGRSYCARCLERKLTAQRAARRT